jgi:hypothetical protein
MREKRTGKTLNHYIIIVLILFQNSIVALTTTTIPYLFCKKIYSFSSKAESKTKTTTQKLLCKIFWSIG